MLRSEGAGPRSEEVILTLTIELEQEEDGRWIAEVMDFPGVMAFGQNREEAFTRVQAIAFQVLADRLEHGELAGETTISFQAT